tara:strand:- start:9718 stop:10113 length:396 start_codon:yes stop_codon:yes gene_type:complete
MEEQIIQTSIDVVTPVLESAVVLGGEYAKKSGRSILTGTDLEYALKFCARNVTGKHLGTLFPEIHSDSESDSGSEESDSESEEDEPPFTRYTGDDETLNKVNECYDTWNEWVPLNPTEQMLKNSINSRQWT